MKAKLQLLKSAVLFILVTSSAFAQIVTIPDATFKYKLVNHVPLIDLNLDGEIQFNEAEIFNGTMNISYDASDPDYITDVTGLEVFINLEEFIASYQNIQSIDLSENTALKLFNASGNEFTSLEFSNHPMLESIQSNYGELTTLDVSGAPNLIYLNAQGNELTTINLSENQLLEGIQLDNNPILEYDFSQNPLLRFVNCRNNAFSSLDLSSNPMLIAIDCQDNTNLSYINLKNGNNEGLNLSGSGPSCAFYDLPLLETVCLDNIESPLATFIEDHVGHSLTFQEECHLGIEESRPIVINLYPNPTDGFLMLKSNSTIIQTEVCNILGKSILMYQQYGREQFINLQHLSSGLYLLKVTTEENTQQTLKFLKN